MTSNFSSNSYKVRIPGYENRFRSKIVKPGRAYRLIRGLLVLVIFFTFVGNLIFILEASTNLLNGCLTGEEKSRARPGQHPLLPGDEKDEGL